MRNSLATFEASIDLTRADRSPRVMNADPEASGSARPLDEHDAEIGAVHGAGTVEVGGAGPAPLGEQKSDVGAVHEGSQTKVRY